MRDIKFNLPLDMARCRDKRCVKRKKCLRFEPDLPKKLQSLGMEFRPITFSDFFPSKNQEDGTFMCDGFIKEYPPKPTK